jgi:hypothetical protein
VIPLLCVVSMTVASPMNAWSYSGTILADGGVEYRFDPTSIKNGGATADALDASGSSG